jgi:hypothetical protein
LNNRCCGKYKPKHPDEDFTNLRENLDDDQEPITSQPGNASTAPEGNWDATSVPIAMPAPGQEIPTERTGLTSGGQGQTYNPYPQWD